MAKAEKNVIGKEREMQTGKERGMMDGSYWFAAVCLSGL